ncbi:hypothetical protein SAMN02982929_06203 [Saccharopolyspora kobensis]|uniref:Uncharacterized protein n=1 Tax=Saccharopolyspora kobensis TaxID=146035 RepID=A0A1H6EF50_9PSEU|nr:hypothetical protein SAMN02982929_06203 [Saccharopolyspora kobensis]SFD56025.1 hypothetical protein SAMN05216506_10583 [Saccharopolyspora kobensis]
MEVARAVGASGTRHADGTSDFVRFQLKFDVKFQLKLRLEGSGGAVFEGGEDRFEQAGEAG